VKALKRIPQSPFVRVLAVLPLMGVAVGLLLWRGPSLSGIADAFAKVEWYWVVVAITLNLVSVLARSLAWRTVIHSAMPPPRPTYGAIFSAFCVGLFANAVLPGRIGELARVAVLVRRLPGRRGAWATLVGTVFAHRVFDVVPVVLLVLYVLATAQIPAWALTGILVAVGVGVGFFGFAFLSARRQNSTLDGLGAVRRVVAMLQQGFGVVREPMSAAIAVFFQIVGWMCQLFAVYTAMRAFHIHAPVPAAALVLLLMNVVTIFPFWPGNLGLVQGAIASALRGGYGVRYSVGFAYGLGLQAIEASVGIGVGLVFLAREGLSYAMLRGMPDAAGADDRRMRFEEDEEEDERLERAGVS
jgi:uncharacterized protein (TIRG00374 family)